MDVKHTCPNCESGEMSVFFRAGNIPAHSVLLLQSHDEAVSFPKGDIVLGHCPQCGFVSNVAFDPALNEYDERYEATRMSGASGQVDFYFIEEVPYVMYFNGDVASLC